MKEYRPQYYDTFRCLASACPDSCCHEWEIQVDEASACRYRSLPGQLGEKLRNVLTDEDGCTYFVNEKGRCPMWQEDGLCRLQAQFGEQMLCTTCREFPRLRHDYGDFVELGLELSCPEAARLILAGEGETLLCREAEQTEEPDYDSDIMRILLRSRKTAISILQGAPNAACARLLLYGYAVQEELDGGEPAQVPSESDLTQLRDVARLGDLWEIADFYRQLDILTDRWRDRLAHCGENAALPPQTLPLLRYYVNRYWLQAVSDYDLVGRVKFMLVSALLIAALGGDYAQTAQLYSKEIENSAENMDALLDGMYTQHCFTDTQILGMLQI